MAYLLRAFIFLILPFSFNGGKKEMPMNVKKAAFAAGCFWGVEKFYWQLPGVLETQVGYAGGHTENPSYEEICQTNTGHVEAVEITYDPVKISYEELLITFWQYHDPTTKNRQGPDIGSQYRSVIFYYDEEQKAAAEKSRQILEKEKVFSKPIVTEIIPAAKFWRAEDYHQKYLKKNPFGYCSHHLQSTRIASVLKSKESLKNV